MDGWIERGGYGNAESNNIIDNGGSHEVKRGIKVSG